MQDLYSIFRKEPCLPPRVVAFRLIMNAPPGRNSIAVALWVNAIALVAILLTLVARQNPPSLLPLAFGQDGRPTVLAPQPIAGGGGVFLMPAQFSDHVWGCYVIDIDRQTLLAYACSGSPPQLRLTAARNFTWYLRLKDFNTEKPRPDEVRRLVEKQLQDANRPPTTEPTQQGQR